MKHTDPEVLALIALGESAASEEDLKHLEECGECTEELRALSEASVVGRSASEVGVLLRPSARVWDAISDEIRAEPEQAAVDVVRAPIPIRRFVLAGVAAVVVAGLVVGGIVGWNALHPAASSEVASAKLAALPDWSGASGSAVVRQFSDGARVLQIHLSSRSTGADFREAWLMTTDLKHLVSIGVVSGSTATLRIPKNIDLDQYNVVDVSDEPHDGNPHHSGNSIVRGELGLS